MESAASLLPLGGEWVPPKVLAVGVGAIEDEIESLLPPPRDCLDEPRPNTHPGSPAPLEDDPPRIIFEADRPNVLVGVRLGEKPSSRSSASRAAWTSSPLSVSHEAAVVSDGRGVLRVGVLATVFLGIDWRTDSRLFLRSMFSFASFCP